MNRNKMERIAKRVVRRASRTILRDRRPYDMAYAAYARVFADAATTFTDHDVRYYRERSLRKALVPSQRKALQKAEARLFHARLAVQDVPVYGSPATGCWRKHCPETTEYEAAIDCLAALKRQLGLCPYYIFAPTL